ncbi:hypothetical protein N0V90_003451 [Kalmusia sp. IMI 367209]|nr:hypothetical protein N0V90_003451 [Kalmusia sp. IMI 367209]
MVDICSTLGEKADEWGVGTADMIQFAAAIGMASCSGGPITSFYTGRPDSWNPTPLGSMPTARTNATSMVSLFAAKNFSITELVALTGAHTIGRKLDGTPMDDTIGEWDNNFYNQTAAGSAPGSVAADTFMSQSDETGEEWAKVGQSLEAFHWAFVPAMEKLSLMGHQKGELINCSEVVREYASSAKMMRKMFLKGRRKA